MQVGHDISRLVHGVLPELFDAAPFEYVLSYNAYKRKSFARFCVKFHCLNHIPHHKNHTNFRGGNMALNHMFQILSIKKFTLMCYKNNVTTQLLNILCKVYQLIN